MAKKSNRNKKGPASNGPIEKPQTVLAPVAMQKSEEIGQIGRAHV